MNRTRRRGYHLVELMLAVAGIVMVTSLVTVTMAALIQVDRSNRRQRTDLTTLAALSDRFRRDAHAAAGTEPAPEFARDANDRLRFNGLGGSWVEYAVKGSALEVRRQRPDAGSEPGVESFAFRDRDRPILELTLRDGHPVAVLRWPRRPGKAATPPARDWRVETAVGRDRRLSTLTAETRS